MNIEDTRNALLELLALARGEVEMAEFHEKKAGKLVSSAASVLAAAGRPTEQGTIRTLLAHEAGLYAPEDYAAKAVDELLPAAAEPVATPAEVRT